MKQPRLIHHGAREGVTGSCHQLWMDEDSSVLIDCGQFQGADAPDDDELALDFAIDGIKALIITHVHIDHVGRIPNLLAAGFEGPILCSEPSARLLPIVLEDAFRLTISRDQAYLERYLKIVEQRIIALPYDHWFSLHDTDTAVCKVRLQPAGHVLGSAYVEFDLQTPARDSRRIVFSGDLGAPHSPLLPDLAPPERADLLVLESTYGDRRHEDRTHRRERLQAAIERALADQGSVLIPSFSIGRTQELLYELEEILFEHSQSDDDSGSSSNDPVDWPELPIILDSPLASRFTRTYKDLQVFWDDDARRRLEEGRKPLSFRQLVTVDSHDEHLRVVEHLAATARPAIVIAGNGMCSGGRIVNYLKAMLGDPRHHVLFVGYQGKGTPGRDIQTYGPEGGYVDLDGERIDIRASIDTVGGYSAHADQADLVGFVTRMKQWPGEIRLIHGEPQAKQRLAELLRARYREAGQPGEVTIP
ncbi:MBL fold metallo-hydrolase RNA specificity domain-containing protein [Stutzerimonas balearica]|uniref:MBL fold metallo-hydrolase RNA specificity domain-containing protein n=1 Tax=Stutzerimonas balearica TaxID=74829 RepID=UPI00190DA4D7|nr:MBL fold metallo-hydrolase [Stutzerimonas balearica]MBK3748615.1 MBL fold metallo-hydrolase [Stutzerimonas balearica]MBK3826812.1 MBL fold metallo-hydrolase [Stutzerimonas balearica]MBK3856502.1 MBL fold metallo-hydrolase [Stutzerimonas balearica]